MKHLFHKIVLIPAVALLFTACSKSGDPEPDVDISGKWTLTTAESNIQLKDEAPETSSEDFSEDGIYFQFNQDGSYSTNSALGIGDISSTESVQTGTYTFSNGGLTLTFQEADLNVPITLTFNSKVDGNQMIISLGREDLVSGFAVSGESLDPFTKAYLQIFLDLIVNFDYKLTLVKS